MEFREWLIINEGAMGLSYKVYKKIVDFFIYAKTEYEINPKKDIPARVIPLDFEGTRYDFLQRFNPILSVKVRNTARLPEANGAEGVYMNQPEHTRLTREGFFGEIILAAKAESNIASTIEHEVLHFVQDLIRRHAKETVVANPNRRDKRWVNKNGDILRPGFRRSKKDQESDRKNFRIGGLPNKKILSRIIKKYDVDGYAHGSQKQRRTTHAHRPTEKMTNLASHIADKRMGYLNLIINELKINPLETTWEELKANIEFMKRLSDNKRKSVFTSPEHYKSLDREAYKFYHKEIFKKFIDSTDWEDTFELLKAERSLKEKIKDVNKNKKQKSLEDNADFGVDLKGYTVEDFGKGVRVKVDYFDRVDFSKIDQFYDSELEEGEENSAYENAEEMFRKLKIKESDGYSFAVNAQGLKKIFDKIREQKSKETSQILRCDWDHFANTIADQAAYKLSDYMRKISGKYITKEKILDIFYPDPQEECKEIE